jgi:hypothetical protein
VSLATAASMRPPSIPRTRTLDLDDDDRYFTVKCHPIMDVHSAVRKQVRLPSQGVIEQMLGCDEEDLRTAAENSNRAVASGRPPVIQIGHTALQKDKPEASLPKEPRKNNLSKLE